MSRLSEYTKKMAFENGQLKEIQKVLEINDLDTFLESEVYSIRIGAIRRYKELSGMEFPGMTLGESKLIAQVDMGTDLISHSSKYRGKGSGVSSPPIMTSEEAVRYMEENVPKWVEEMKTVSK